MKMGPVLNKELTIPIGIYATVVKKSEADIVAYSVLFINKSIKFLFMPEYVEILLRFIINAVIRIRNIPRMYNM